MKRYSKLKRNTAFHGNSIFGLTVLLFTLISLPVQGRQFEENSIRVHMQSSVQVPADQVIFTVNINAEGKTPRKAFTLHKEREELLAGLLMDLDIPENQINYEPVSISHRKRNNYSEESNITRQQVSIRFNDFELYEEIQLELIKAGFDQFRGSFSSTETEAATDEALKNAIRSAREKAETIALASGLKLGPILGISYSHFTQRPRPATDMMELRTDAPDMMNFKQSLEVNASVDMLFKILY